MSSFMKRKAAEAAAAGTSDGSASSSDAPKQPRLATTNVDELTTLMGRVGLKMLSVIAHFMWAIPETVASRVASIAAATGAQAQDVNTAVHIATVEACDLEAGLASCPVIVRPASG